MKFRHEWKHEITATDLLALRARLWAVAKPDPNAINGTYRIRSLYFEDPWDTALREKLDGVNRREKYRLRYYNGDTGFILLEKKSKINSLCAKESVPLTREQTESLLAGDIVWMKAQETPLLHALYVKMKDGLLRPRTIVEYTREPFVFAPGNVRVTVDSQIRTGILCTDFLRPDCVTVPVGLSPVILEVKWDDFLPDVIRDAVQLEGRRAAAFSKYAACRVYG